MRSERYDSFIDLGEEGSVVTPEHLLTLKDQVSDASYSRHDDPLHHRAPLPLRWQA